MDYSLLDVSSTRALDHLIQPVKESDTDLTGP